MVYCTGMRKCSSCGQMRDRTWFSVNKGNRCRQCLSQLRRDRSSSDRIKARANIRTAHLKLGGSCTCCGESTEEFLQIDHIEGKQDPIYYIHRVVNKKSYSVVVHVLKLEHPEHYYRLLCSNCNHSLGVRGYCPHRPFARYGLFRASGTRPTSYRV